MATPTQWGSEFLVNTITDGFQSQPVVTRLSTGAFVVAWTDDSGTLGDPGGDAIHAQIFQADGSKSGAEFLVNAAALGSQSYPSLTSLSDGRFVAAWADEEIGGDNVRAQVFNPDGSKSGAEFVIANLDATPALSTLTDGRFVAAWQSQDGADPNVRAQAFNADGTKSGAELLLNTTTLGPQYLPVITGLSDGGFVATWLHQGNSFQNDIRAQIFNANGGKSGFEFVVSPQGAQDYLTPEVTALAGGKFVVAWTVRSGNDTAVEAQVFNADGNKAGSSFLASPPLFPGYEHRDPTLATLADGRFVAAYTFEGDASVDIAAQVFNPDGTKSGSPFYANLPSWQGENSNPALSVLADGRLVVSWTDRSPGDGSDWGIRGQIFDPRESAVSVTGGPSNDDFVGTKFGDTLAGGDGGDHFAGGGGGDALIGGAGDDTASFAHDFNDYTVMDFGGRILVKGPEGTDTLTSIEHLKFADATITPVDDGDPLFDSLYYLSRNGDVFHAGVDAREHFDTFGWHEGRDPNALFDVSGYLAVNPEVAAAGINPLEHYHLGGWKEGRDPSADFDTTLYLIHNPDVAAAGVDPLAHYLAFGANEGRQAFQAVGAINAGFDAQYYLLHNPDVAAAGVDARAHFDSFGWHEGRNPNGWFDSAGYLSHYADVAVAGVNPLDHYMQFGWQEGRDASAGFDTLGYLAANPDVAAAGVNPLEHFLSFGIYEGRQAVDDGLWH